MPVMDGYEATRRIKATPAGKQTPIVALTASALEEQRAKVLAAGCDAHVGKPFKEREIFDCLEHVLGVRFRYQTPPADAVTGAARGLALAAEELALLPAELCARLRQAAQDLDSQALEALNAEIARYSAPLAEAVKALVDDFRFDVIMDAMPEP